MIRSDPLSWLSAASRGQSISVQHCKVRSSFVRPACVWRAPCLRPGVRPGPRPAMCPTPESAARVNMHRGGLAAFWPNSNFRQGYMPWWGALPADRFEGWERKDERNDQANQFRASQSLIQPGIPLSGRNLPKGEMATSSKVRRATSQIAAELGQLSVL